MSKILQMLLNLNVFLYFMSIYLNMVYFHKQISWNEINGVLIQSNGGGISENGYVSGSATQLIL